MVEVGLIAALKHKQWSTTILVLTFEKYRCIGVVQSEKMAEAILENIRKVKNILTAPA